MGRRSSTRERALSIKIANGSTGLTINSMIKIFSTTPVAMQWTTSPSRHMPCRGKSGTITIDANVGETVNLLGAPTREGYTFKFWKGSEYAAGAEYKVEGDHAFTAEWEKSSSDSGKAESDTGTKPVSKTDSKVLQATGDDMVMSFVALATMAFVSLIVLVVYARRKTA